MHCVGHDLTYGMVGPIVGRVKNVIEDGRGGVFMYVDSYFEAVNTACLDDNLFVDVSWSAEVILYTGHSNIVLTHVFINTGSRFVGAQPLEKVR
jgi:hypothetical protein